MGQKVNPIGLRLGIVRGWESSWYGGKKFSDKLVEEGTIKNGIQESYYENGQLWYETTYKDGKWNGPWVGCDEDGSED